ncbi:MAG: ABC transporter ATP-binding protein [Desulfatibacillaceae bacterium]
MLLIEDLRVEIGGHEILQHIDLEIKPGETHVLFGPNGSGKTSLLMAIMGYPQYKITEGRMVFKDQDITRMPMNERARLGIGMSYQRPPSIPGVKTRQMVNICSQAKGTEADAEALSKKVNFASFLDREINVGFSGGEIKRSELLQLMAQDPDFMMFDEPESGVDLENMQLVGATIAEMLQRDLEERPEEISIKQWKESRSKMGLIITHTGYILDYLNADKAQVLFDGVLSCKNNPNEILDCVGEYGYEECVRCVL